MHHLNRRIVAHPPFPSDSRKTHPSSIEQKWNNLRHVQKIRFFPRVMERCLWSAESKFCKQSFFLCFVLGSP